MSFEDWQIGKQIAQIVWGMPEDAMWDFVLYILAPILHFFADVYKADERPEARRFTLGCAAIVLAVVLLFVLLTLLWRFASS